MSDALTARKTSASKRDPLRFERSYPIDFRLLMGDVPAVLYTLPPNKPQSVTLEIRNQSKADITIEPADGNTKANEKTHHFALCFRPGTLTRRKDGPIGVALKDSSDWSLSTGIGPDGADCLYLLSTTEKTVAAGGALKLKLDNLQVDGARGTRPTVVELRYGKSDSAHLKTRELSLAGTREIHLSVLNEFADGLAGIERLDGRLAELQEELTEKANALQHKIGGLPTSDQHNKLKQAVDALTTVVEEVEQLRDITDPPLIAEIVDGWEMIPPDAKEHILTIRITVNKYFSHPDGKAAVVPTLICHAGNKTRLTLHREDSGLTQSGGQITTGEAMLEPVNLSQLAGDERTGTELLMLRANVNNEFPDVIQFTVPLKASAKSGPRPTRLRLSCENVGNPNGTAAQPCFENFNLWIPIRIGPISLDGNAGAVRFTGKHNTIQAENGLEVTNQNWKDCKQSRRLMMYIEGDTGHLKMYNGLNIGGTGGDLKINQDGGNVTIGKASSSTTTVNGPLTVTDGSLTVSDGPLKIGKELGIGPNYSLQIHSRTHSGAYIRGEESDGTYGLLVAAEKSGKSSTRFVVWNNGNVGIGVYKAGYKLHVAGDSQFSGPVKVGPDLGVGANYKLQINSGTSNGIYIKAESNPKTYGLCVTNKGRTGMTVWNDGKVMIGSYGPPSDPHTLGVSGSAEISGSLSIGSATVSGPLTVKNKLSVGSGQHNPFEIHGTADTKAALAHLRNAPPYTLMMACWSKNVYFYWKDEGSVLYVTKLPAQEVYV